jgi:hypothetical protein
VVSVRTFLDADAPLAWRHDAHLPFPATAQRDHASAC